MTRGLLLLKKHLFLFMAIVPCIVTGTSQAAYPFSFFNLRRKCFLKKQNPFRARSDYALNIFHPKEMDFNLANTRQIVYFVEGGNLLKTFHILFPVYLILFMMHLYIVVIRNITFY